MSPTYSLRHLPTYLQHPIHMGLLFFIRQWKPEGRGVTPFTRSLRRVLNTAFSRWRQQLRDVCLERDVGKITVTYNN